MPYHFLRLYRNSSKTYITVEAPLPVENMTPQMAAHLNGWVDWKYPGFAISDFVTKSEQNTIETA